MTRLILLIVLGWWAAGLWSCGVPAPHSAVAELPNAKCEVVHVRPDSAPEGSDRYFKVHLTLHDGGGSARFTQELQYYFNFGMRQHIWLTNGRDSINPDIYFHESAQGLSPKNSFFVGFPEDLVPGGTLAISGPVAGDRSFSIDPRPRT